MRSFCRGKRRTGLRTWQAVVPRQLTRHESRIVIGELLKDKQLILSPAVCKVHMSAKMPPKHSRTDGKTLPSPETCKRLSGDYDVLFKFSLNLPDEQIPLVITNCT